MGIVVETAIDFGIGFLCALFLGLLIVPLVVKRSLRRSVQRVISAAPYPPAEIRADKDQLRNKLATSTRQLELSLAEMKAKTMSKLAELEQKTGVIGQLKDEIGDKTDTIVRLTSEIKEKAARNVALEDRNKALVERLRAVEEQFAIRGDTLYKAEEVLAGRQAELMKLVAELGQRAAVADQQSEEIAALHEQVDTIRASVTDYENTLNRTVLHAWGGKEDADAPWNAAATRGKPHRVDSGRRRF